MKKPTCLKQWILFVKKQITNNNAFKEIIVQYSLKKIKEEYGERGIDKLSEKLNIKRNKLKI